jgi:hypothetical protein
MRKTMITLAMLAGMGMSGPNGGDLTADQQATCDHLQHAFPTPASVAVALDGRVLFTCQGDSSIGGLTYVMRDRSELEDWQTRTHDRMILEGEGDDD